MSADVLGHFPVDRNVGAKAGRDQLAGDTLRASVERISRRTARSCAPVAAIARMTDELSSSTAAVPEADFALPPFLAPTRSSARLGGSAACREPQHARWRFAA
jgi:hypothetical protein